MTTKNFNAKKVLMSTVAAVVFSFVFTTNANAQSVENRQKDNLEVRVKTTSNENKQNGLEEFTDFVVNMFQTVFGVRV
jgi:hypothetical protein